MILWNQCSENEVWINRVDRLCSMFLSNLEYQITFGYSLAQLFCDKELVQLKLDVYLDPYLVFCLLIFFK